MAKVKERKSESWKPDMANGTGMISKNQKRKAKRLSLSALKTNSDGTLSKKSSLGPLSKIKENLNQSLTSHFVSKKKENKLLSTSLPIKVGKTLTHTLLTKNVKSTGILSNSNTPKSKGNKVTFNMTEENKFVDTEAKEGEEPVTDKVVKPYEKGSRKRKQLKRRMSLMVDQQSEESDNGSDDESDDSTGVFVDMEASEGEETDDSDAFDEDDNFEEGSEDGYETDENGEGEYESSEEEDSEDDPKSEQESENDDENDETMVLNKSAATANRRKSVTPAAAKREKTESTLLPKKIAAKTKCDTSQTKIVNVKAEPEPKQAIKTSPVKKAEKKKQSKDKVKTYGADGEEQNIRKEDDEKAKNKQLSPYVGFIRKLDRKISLEDLKSTLSKKVDEKYIIGIRENKMRNVFVYMKDEDSLDDLLNNEFAVNEKFKFVVYKARESVSDKSGVKFIAFLPRVPLTVTEEALKDALVKIVGTDRVKKIQSKRRYTNMQLHNILVHFTDLESLQKMVQMGEFKIGTCSITVRAAFEASVKIPTFRVVVTNVPEKTSEAMLKKAIESAVGRGTVKSVRFSQTKTSFAFVTLENEDAQKKSLEAGKNIIVNGTQVEVIEFKARNGKKRAAPNEQAKERKKNMAKKRKLEDIATTDGVPKGGKRKKAVATAIRQNVDDISLKTNIKMQPQLSSKRTDAKKNVKKDASSTPSQEVVAKSKTHKQFPKSRDGSNVKQRPQRPITVSVPGKGANPKQEYHNSKGAAHAKSEIPSLVNVSGNVTSPSNPKRRRKKDKNTQQQGPKLVDAKKKVLSMKIESKKKNKKGMKPEAL